MGVTSLTRHRAKQKHLSRSESLWGQAEQASRWPLETEPGQQDEGAGVEGTPGQRDTQCQSAGGCRSPSVWWGRAHERRGQTGPAPRLPALRARPGPGDTRVTPVSGESTGPQRGPRSGPLSSLHSSPNAGDKNRGARGHRPRETQRGGCGWGRLLLVLTAFLNRKPRKRWGHEGMLRRVLRAGTTCQSRP